MWIRINSDLSNLPFEQDIKKSRRRYMVYSSNPMWQDCIFKCWFSGNQFGCDTAQMIIDSPLYYRVAKRGEDIEPLDLELSLILNQ